MFTGHGPWAVGPPLSRETAVLLGGAQRKQGRGEELMGNRGRDEELIGRIGQ